MDTGKISYVVIIATRNRAEALYKYALSSLENSRLKNFLCLVWDASTNDLSREAINKRQWSYPIFYFKAMRRGSSSQRNDAVQYVLSNWENCKYVLFIDDDCEISTDAMEGLERSFKNDDVWGVNIPLKLLQGKTWYDKGFRRFFKKQGRRVVEPYLFHYATFPETNGCEIDWTGGGSMAFRIELFRDLMLCFPEEFQMFGGYALAEDLAFSFYVKKKLGKKIINACSGYLYHHAYPSGRLDIDRWAAAHYYNLTLLFNSIYEDLGEYKLQWYRLRFQLFLWAIMLEYFLATWNVDVWAGVSTARKLLKRSKKLSFVIENS